MMTKPSSPSKPLTPDAAHPVTPHHTWIQRQAAKDIFAKATGPTAHRNAIGVLSYAARKKY